VISREVVDEQGNTDEQKVRPHLEVTMLYSLSAGLNDFHQDSVGGRQISSSTAIRSFRPAPLHDITDDKPP
jgi:hypothetical protein